MWVKLFAGMVLLSVLLAGMGALAGESEKGGQPTEIEWYRADFPPVTIPKGPNAGSGFFDKAAFLLANNLPQYQHNFEHVANFDRIIAEIRRGKNACCPSLYKTPAREEFIEFSVPAAVVLPNVVITRRNAAPRFSSYLTENKRLKLGEALKDESLVLGVSKGRKYSGGIDAIIDGAKDAKHLLGRSGSDVFRGLLEMLLNDRIDYLIGYPIEIKYFLQNQEDLGKLQIFFIDENTIDYTIGYVGCPKTPWGREVIGEINKVLLTHRETPEYLGYYEHWLSTETVELYRQIAVDFYRGQ